MYDRIHRRVTHNKAEFSLCDSVNTEQVIDKLLQPKPIRKSWAMLNIYKRLQYTNKPICSAMGIHNPVKLDISKLNLKALT